MTNDVPAALLLDQRALSDATSSHEEPPRYFQTFQVCMASISFLSSLTIVISIAFIGNVGLSTPYRRIIFGLSLADIFQSLALLTGPSSVPEGYSSYVESEAPSCRINGLFLAIGASAVMMYTFFLCLYYLYKLKYKMSDDTFRHRVETKLHVFIIVLSVVLNLAALAMNIFHTNPYFLSFCSFAAVPTKCRMDENTACQEDHMFRVMIFAYIETIALPFICFLGIIIIMALLYQYAFVLHKNVQSEVLPVHVPTSLRNQGVGVGTLEHEHEQEQEEEHISAPSESSSNHEDEETPQDRVQNLSRLFRREITIQATLYVMSFCLTYMPMIINTVFAIFYLYPTVICAMQAFFWPLGGFLNILVYTRPKVASLRRDYPECSRLRGFWLVLRAGGEIPDDIHHSSQSTSCCDCGWCRLPAYLESMLVVLRSGNWGSSYGDRRSSSIFSSNDRPSSSSY